MDTGRFCRTNDKTVPGIGLAPNLSEMLFKLKSIGAREQIGQGQTGLHRRGLDPPSCNLTARTNAKQDLHPRMEKEERSGSGEGAWLAQNPDAKQMRINSPRLKALIDQFGLAAPSGD